MRYRALMLCICGAVIGGCSQQAPDQATSQSSTNGASQTDVLSASIMQAKPEKSISVREALTKTDGDKVILTGRTPGGNTKPFNSAVATVVLLDPRDLDREEIREEFECEDAATCPSCKKLFDQHGVRVEIVDQTGMPLPVSLEGYRGIKQGSTITVEGEIRRDGKDKKLVRILATKFYPE